MNKRNSKLYNTVIGILISTIMLTVTAIPCVATASNGGMLYINGIAEESMEYTVIDGTSMVSAAELAQALSLAVTWSDSMVTFSGNNIRTDIYIENSIAEVNGEKCYLPHKPFVENDKMFVPLRFVAETFGYGVKYDDESGNIYVSYIKNDAQIINPQIVTFTQGSTSERHYGQSDITLVKHTANNAEQPTERNTYYRFDVRNIDPETAGSIFLRVYCIVTQGEYTNVVEAYGTDDEWSLATLSHSNQPELGEKIDETAVFVPLKWYEFDVTDYIKREASDDGIASIVLTDTYGFSHKTIYAGYNNANAPHLAVYDAKVNKETNVNAPEMRKNVELSGEKDIIYARRYPTAPYRPFYTQTIDKLDGFVPNQAVELDRYGGWINDTVKCSEKTGYFHTEKINGRWWLVTPDGNPYISVGLNCVRGNGTEWGDEISARLTEYGFNSEGGWSSKITKSDGSGFPYIYIFDNFINGYVTLLKSKTGKSYCVPVFDSGFKKYVVERVKSGLTESLINDEYLIGYVSDNEQYVDYDIIDKYLALDPNDPYAKESLDAVWNWLRERHGEDVSVADITWRDMDDFRGYVYDTYYKTIREEIQKYDKNHMYIGSRYHMTETMYSPGLMKAASNRLDVITYNIYYFWTVDNEPFKNLETKYGDKPIMVTEFYTKGENTGMQNKDGAGYVVSNQKERGLYYQNYTLSLLTTKNCVGWHWFLYYDGEGNGSNKGIVDEKYNPHEDAVNEMKKLNDNVYRLIDYIDSGGGK